MTCSGGRFFQQLLMAALDGALALSEADDVAVLVGQHLEFDVARVLDVLLHVEVAIAEGFGGFGLRLLVKRGQVRLRCGRRACRARRRRRTP